MNHADFLLGVGAIVGGALLTILVESARNQIERRQRRNDRREEFERTTLIEMQDVLDAYIRASHIAHADYYDKGTFPTGEFTHMQITRDRAIAQDDARARMVRLTSRVDDDAARRAIGELEDAIRTMFAAETVDDARDAQMVVAKRHIDAQQRLGELLRDV